MFNIAMVLVMCSVANSPVKKIFSSIFNLLHETNLKERKKREMEVLRILKKTHHPLYGTRIAECRMCPTKLFSKGLSEKLPWPLLKEYANRITNTFLHQRNKNAVTKFKKKKKNWNVYAYQSWPRTKIAQNMVP